MSSVRITRHSEKATAASTSVRLADHPGGPDRCWIANGTSHVGEFSLLWLPIDDLTG